MNMLKHAVANRRAEKGQGLVEYALILVLVSVVVIVILAMMGPAVSDIFGELQCTVKHGAPKTAPPADPEPGTEVRWRYIWDEGSWNRYASKLPAGMASSFVPSLIGCHSVMYTDAGFLLPGLVVHSEST